MEQSLRPPARLRRIARPQRGHPMRQPIAAALRARAAARNDDKDLKLFVVSFTAFFVAIYTFIA